jgi:hypothetical protein
LRADERGKFEHTRFGTAGVWLRFFTTKRGTNKPADPLTISAPVAVGYQIVRTFTATNPLNTGTAYRLFRAEVRPVENSGRRPGVIEAGYNLDPAAVTHYTRNNLNGAANNGSEIDDPRSIQIPGTATGQRKLDAVIAENVIDFGVRCYVRDPTGGLRLIFPATATGGLSNATNRPLRSKLPSATPPEQWVDAGQTDAAQPFPDVVDVMVRLLTDEGAALIANIERVQTPALTVPIKYNNNVQEWWWGVAQENSRVYTRRIVLNAKSL